MTPDPGYFVMQDDKAKEIASRIICDGYIELNDETAKKYGDSFYYTKTGDEQLSDIPAYIYLKTMLKENHAYAIDEERFSEMYGKVK